MSPPSGCAHPGQRSGEQSADSVSAQRADHLTGHQSLIICSKSFAVDIQERHSFRLRGCQRGCAFLIGSGFDLAVIRLTFQCEPHAGTGKEGENEGIRASTSSHTKSADDDNDAEPDGAIPCARRDPASSFQLSLGTINGSDHKSL